MLEILIGNCFQAIHKGYYFIKKYAHTQARIQEFTLVGVPWIGEGSGDRQGPQRVPPGSS